MRFGRQLSTIMQSGNLLATYTYNADGLRTSKTVGGATTEYYWMNGTLYAQKTGEEYLYFLYDESGMAYGFVVKNNTEESYYYYEFNLQGDIIGIINSAGTKVVEYTYGAWGDILSITGSMATTIGQKNPLRYRGYYYDGETGFYYLQSRYYDTEVCRFVNADGFVTTGQDITGYNMYAYCGNNPTNRLDLHGNFWGKVSNFFKKVWKSVKKWAKETFGAGCTTTVTISKVVTPIIPEPLPITAETGTETTQTISEYGDSSKPISVYANGDLQNPGTGSSAGISINICDFSLNLNVGFENIGISGSVANGNTTDSFGVKLDLSKLKIGFEGSEAIQWDNTTRTTYTNVSVSGWSLLAAYYYVTTGQYVPNNQNGQTTPTGQQGYVY